MKFLLKLTKLTLFIKDAGELYPQTTNKYWLLFTASYLLSLICYHHFFQKFGVNNWIVRNGVCQRCLNMKTNLHTSGQVSTAMLLQIDEFTEFTSRQEWFRYAATALKKSIPLFFFFSWATVRITQCLRNSGIYTIIWRRHWQFKETSIWSQTAVLCGCFRGRQSSK